ncbi:hypothetical protein [Vallitalea okinawensis]|uniref:hypothetical protein n=1 Tax=Vallitalea okinawensis TaxID=2078660 RepID=UPI000CFBBB24|nr:hypothetical protein [Vallitalea okinawensis]
MGNKRAIGFMSAVVFFLSLSLTFSVKAESTQLDYIDAANQVRQQLQEEEAKEWATLSEQQKYNRHYGDIVEQMDLYYEQFFKIYSCIETDETMSFSNLDIFESKVSVFKIEAIRTLQKPDQHPHSLDYIKQTLDELSNLAQLLKNYAFFRNVETKEPVEEAIENYNSYYEKVYNYYLLTRDDQIYPQDLCQEPISSLEKKLSKLSTYDELDIAASQLYELVKDNENSYEAQKEFKDLMKGIEVTGFDEEIYSAATQFIDEIESVAMDKMLGEKVKNDQTKELYDSLSKAIKDLKELYEKEETDTIDVSTKINAAVLAKEQEYKEIATDNGFSTFAEYKAYLENQEEDRFDMMVEAVIQEKEEYFKQLEEEMARSKAEWDQTWADLRIDFSKSQYEQKYNKDYYMSMVQKKAKMIYSNNEDVEMEVLLQSLYFDTMWELVNQKDSDRQLMQECYDRYPSDFINITWDYLIRLEN